jgi:hypothetical protein
MTLIPVFIKQRCKLSIDFSYQNTYHKNYCNLLFQIGILSTTATSMKAGMIGLQGMLGDKNASKIVIWIPEGKMPLMEHIWPHTCHNVIGLNALKRAFHVTNT